MKTVQSSAALLCIALMLAPLAGAETVVVSPVYVQPKGGNFFQRLTGRFVAPSIPGINLSNSNRLENLLHAGKIYLSLQDAIALSLENNLDIEIARYNPAIAQANVLRAQAGGLLRGLSQAVTAGPTSAASLSNGGASNLNPNAGSNSSSTSSNGTIITATGVAIPQYDDILQVYYGVAHQTNIQSNSFASGTSSLVTQSNQYNVSYQKAWETGTTLNINFNNLGVNSNAPNNSLNPITSSSFQAQITQRLLQGFGSGFGTTLNRRNITIAKNSLNIEDLVFKQQVIQTVYAVTNLYYDLVSFDQDVKVKRQAVEYNERLYSDNKKQVEIGTLAPIEIVKAESELANTQQQLTVSETRLLQQETIIKSYLSRNGLASPSVIEARIIATDSLPTPPATEQIQPIQDLMEDALRKRPEVPQNDINIKNSQLSILGDKSQLLPALDLVASATNNGLAGSPYGVVGVDPLTGAPTTTFRPVAPVLVGGYGTVLDQLFSRKFPNYSVGLSLTVPLRNRSAQADLINDTLTLRQAELRRQQQVNSIRVDVQNAVIAVQQARAGYIAAVKARELAEQTLDAERKKYALGSSTVFLVIQYQRDLATAQGQEVTALSTYAHARNQYDLALGDLLEKNTVDIEEARSGKVKRSSNPTFANPGK